MARVNISRQLVSDVVGVMRGMRERELEQSLTPTNKLLSGADEEHVKFIWGKYYPLKDTTPIEWCVSCKENTTFHIKVVKQGEDGKLHNYKVGIDLSGEMVAPPMRDSSSYNYYVHGTRSYDDAPVEVREQVDAEIAKREIVERWANIEKQVTQYLSASPSLNKAVELWPELALYIPEKYKRKMAEKVTRSKVDTSKMENTLKQINVGEIVAAGVTAKMMGGAA